MPRRLRLAPVLAALAASLSLGTALTHAAPAPFAQPAVPSPDEMDKLTGPIALYPDALVAQILLCAESPYQVTQVNTWVKANAALKGTEAQEAAEKQGFDASFIALVPFPQVLEMMASQHDWTTKLGQAFAADKDAVFNSIQRLRAKAKAVGNLQTTPQQEVVTQQASGGQQVIVIDLHNRARFRSSRHRQISLERSPHAHQVRQREVAIDETPRSPRPDVPVRNHHHA